MDRWNFSEQLAASSFILRTPNSETATPLPWQDTFTLEDITENSFMDSNRSPSVCFPQSMLSMPADCLLNGSLDMADSPPMANHWGDTQLNPSAFSQQIYECEGSLQSPPGLFHHPDLSSEPLFGRASGLQPSSIGPDGSHDCMSLAFTALHSLYSPPTSAVSTPNCKPMPTMPTIDQILTTNKTAISQVSTLLNCSASCSHDPHFPLLVAVTTSKILAWYQAMGRVTTSSSSISSHESSGSASENVMHMPITLGMYKLDGEDEERMRIQLILSELRKVENLVELFVERFCRTTDSSRDGGGLGMHMALGAFLRARMRETFSETIRERRDLSQRDGGG
ncbi:MAG: hypothetical protein M4579_000611 [Chaenotheca gracillima]|nr:MAG: hypothetical protein M4579_000611 [Chaenotheca gracillima]